jgi:hypothetical protein
MFDCDEDCPGDSAHDDGFCARVKPEDDPCSVCGGPLQGERAVSYGQCDNCLPCDYCGKRGHWGGCKAQDRHDARCL